MRAIMKQLIIRSKIKTLNKEVEYSTAAYDYLWPKL
jgi:hypothetical protein